MDLAPGYMDLGLNNLPWSNTRSDLPLFKIVCKPEARAQSFLGREIYTHDPGRALITGLCRDVGASMTQQSRALAGRAPYFMNGSSMNLRELYDDAAAAREVCSVAVAKLFHCTSSYVITQARACRPGVEHSCCTLYVPPGASSDQRSITWYMAVAQSLPSKVGRPRRLIHR